MYFVEVNKSGNESSASLIRRFSKQVKSMGLQRAVRGGQYHERMLSHFKKKKNTLKMLKKRETIERLKKLGKLNVLRK